MAIKTVVLLPQTRSTVVLLATAAMERIIAAEHVANAVRGDNWVHHRGDLGSAQGRALKADMKERFFPAGDKWREMVWARADQTIGWAIKGMTGG